MLAVFETEVFFRRVFSAVFAGRGAEEDGAAGQFQGGFFHFEHFFGGELLIISKQLGSAHIPGAGLQYQPQGFPRIPPIERKGLFPREVKEQIPSADTASQQNLNRVDTAGIVFRDADDLLIGGERQAQKFGGVQGGFEADGQSASFVAVKSHALFPEIFIDFHRICLFS